MAKPTFRRTVTCVVAVECEAVGTAAPQEVGEALIGRLQLQDNFFHYVNETTIHPKAVGLMSSHEGVALEE